MNENKTITNEEHSNESIFYLAISYDQENKNELALQYYRKRIIMGGFEEEIFNSLLNIARIQERMNEPTAIIADSYLKAYHFRPTRAEPLYFLAHYYISAGNLFFGYLFSQMGLEIPLPKDRLFVIPEIYESGLLLQFVDSAYGIGRFQESLAACEKLLKKPNLSSEMKKQIKSNAIHIKTKERS